MDEKTKTGIYTAAQHHDRLFKFSIGIGVLFLIRCT